MFEVVGELCRAFTGVLVSEYLGRGALFFLWFFLFFKIVTFIYFFFCFFYLNAY